MASQKHEATFVGLDIGTSKITCVVGLHQPDLATPSIIGLGQAKANGLKKGVVVDVEETVSSITSALEEAERMSGVAIDRATISVDGSHIQSINSSGVVAVSRADHEIATDDLSRVEAVASGLTLEANREIISVIPRQYNVDDHKKVEDPLGMSGVRLELDAHIITASTPYLKNLHNAVFRSGIVINNQMATPVAAARALLSNQQKQLGCAVIHFGSQTTGIAIYNEGSLCFTSVIPLGSDNITKDLVYGLRISEDVAEQLKVENATASRPRGKTNKKISLEKYGSAGNVYQHDIDTIVSSRLEEIFQLVAQQFKLSKEFTQELRSGVVITGGGANLPDIATFVRTVLDMPVHLGKVTGYSGISDKITDPTFSAVVGLMLHDMETPSKSHGPKISGIFHKVIDKIKSIIKSLLP